MVPSDYPPYKMKMVADRGCRFDLDGSFVDPELFPLLYRTIGFQYGRQGKLFRLPIISGKAALGLSPQVYTPPSSPHTHTVVGYDPGFNNYQHFTVASNEQQAIGRVTRISEDDRGLHVNMKLDSSDFAEKLRKTLDKKLISAFEARDYFGIQSDADLFPEITAPRGGLKFTTSTKEHSMATIQKLKTPSKNIKRKDLSVALRLSGIAAREDNLFDVIALVQSVGENEKIHRLSELKSKDVVGKNVRVNGTETNGVCSDFVEDDYNTFYRLVIAGKIERVEGDGFIIISEIPEPLGEDALRVVQD